MPKLPDGSGSNKRITRKLKAAIDAIRTGQANTQMEAAEIAGIQHTYLSRALSKPHVQEYIRNLCRDQNSSVMLLKSHRLFGRVLDDALKSTAEPSAVATSVATAIQKNEGILAPVDGASGSGGFVFRVELIQAPDGRQAARISANSVPDQGESE